MIAGVADGGPRVGLEDSSLQGRQPYQCAPCEIDASRLPAITVEPDIGEVESGELRWPAEEAAPPHPAIVVEPELADAESGELRWPPPPPASCEAGDGAAATSEGAHCERSQHPAQPQY